MRNAVRKQIEARTAQARIIKQYRLAPEQGKKLDLLVRQLVERINVTTFVERFLTPADTEQVLVKLGVVAATPTPQSTSFERKRPQPTTKKQTPTSKKR